MLAKYAPAGVLINDKLEILQFRGLTDPYLTHSPGLASLNLFKMVKSRLAVEFQKVMQQAGKEEGPVRKEEEIISQTEALMEQTNSNPEDPKGGELRAANEEIQSSNEELQDVWQRMT